MDHRFTVELEMELVRGVPFSSSRRAMSDYVGRSRCSIWRWESLSRWEALSLYLMAVTRPREVVAIESPGFYAVLQAIEHLDVRVLEIPVDPVWVLIWRRWSMPSRSTLFEHSGS